jgi:DNA-directed RNA polymerase specialized sigma24 family protein
MTKLRGPSSGTVIQQLAQLFRDGSATGLTEGELVQRFTRDGDESAFAAILARHGPMVLGVCRQLLHDPNDVDDAFQATFLVMVRKAGSLRRSDLLANWLYGVAYRVAVRTRSSRRVRAGRPGIAGAPGRSLESHSVSSMRRARIFWMSRGYIFW